MIKIEGSFLFKGTFKNYKVIGPIDDYHNSKFNNHSYFVYIWKDKLFKRDEFLKCLNSIEELEMWLNLNGWELGYILDSGYMRYYVLELNM